MLNGKVGFFPSNYVEDPSGASPSATSPPPRPIPNTTTTTTNNNPPPHHNPRPSQGGAGWEKFVSDNGETYYYNESTGESSWDVPEGYHAQ